MPEIVLSKPEEDIIAEGEAARLLLENPAFLQAIEAVRAQCAEMILTSPPAASQKREDAYNLARGLSAVTVQLTTLAAHAEQVLAQAEIHTEFLDQAEPVEQPSDY